MSTKHLNGGFQSPYRCTSSTRPTEGIFVGMEIIESDTGYLRLWNGTSWMLMTPMQSICFYKSTNQNLGTGGVWAGVTFDTTTASQTVNPDSIFPLGSSMTVTLSQPGEYNVNGYVVATGASSIMTRLNSSVYSNVPAYRVDSAWGTASFSSTFRASGTSTTITLEVYPSSACTVYNGTWFRISKMSY